MSHTDYDNHFNDDEEQQQEKYDIDDIIKDQQQEKDSNQEKKQEDYSKEEEDQESGLEGRFSYAEIHGYLNSGTYPTGFSKADKLALRKRSKYFKLKDAQLYYCGKGMYNLRLHSCSYMYQCFKKPTHSESSCQGNEISY